MSSPKYPPLGPGKESVPLVPILKPTSFNTHFSHVACIISVAR